LRNVEIVAVLVDPAFWIDSTGSASGHFGDVTSRFCIPD